MMYVEAMLFAVDKINKNKAFLYGNTLDTRIYDSCGERNYFRENLLAIYDSRTQGLIGPQYSDHAIMATVILDVRGKVTVSYGATTVELGDRVKYNRFYRTVASDDYQIKVMIDIAKHFSWKYVAFVYSNGIDAEKAQFLFKEEATKWGICVPVTYQLPSHSRGNDYVAALNAILRNQNVKVAFLFLTEKDIKKLLEVAENMKERLNHVTFVGGTEWGSSYFITERSRDVSFGAITIQTQIDEVREFREYFLSLKPSTNKRNIWFSQFWEEQFNCSLNNSVTNNISRFCSGNETLGISKGYYRETPVLTVINAVYTFAHIYRQILWEKCVRWNVSGEVCTRRRRILKGPTNRRDVYLKSKIIKFKEPFRDRMFSFNENGAVVPSYDILNFRYDKSAKNYVFSKVGHWYMKQQQSQFVKVFYINNSEIVWKIGNSKAPVSVCSLPCHRGEIAIYTNQQKCCWDCKPCARNDRMINNTCLPCDMDYVPDSCLRNCLPLPETYLDLKHPAILAMLIIIALGLILTITTLAIFLKNFQQRLVKASGRELCVKILIGIMVSYLAPTAFILQPSIIVCATNRFIIGLSLSLCYAPLTLKLIRIYRIFTFARQQVKRPQLVSPRTQVMMSIGLSTVAVLLGLASIFGEKPKIVKSYPSHRRFIVTHCELNGFTVIFNLLYSSVLMLMCSWYAFKTRKFPKNYNETKIIGFTVYITCLIMALCLPIFFFIDDKHGTYKALILCFMCLAIATINLFGLFGQKVKLILQPENQTEDSSTFKTAATNSGSQSPVVRVRLNTTDGNLNLPKKD